MKKMTQTFIKKNFKLLMEFNSYVVRNARVRSAIPNGATVVMTVVGDEKFNEASRAMVVRTGGRRRKIVEARKEGSRWTVRPLEKIEEEVKR